MRIGRFKIRRDMIDSKLDIVTEFIRETGFVPVRVELNYHSDAFDMIGFSNQFEDIENGLEAPLYDAQIITNESEPNIYRFVK